jgi:predicted enzyme related to lactoylglutathione lyase
MITDLSLGGGGARSSGRRASRVPGDATDNARVAAVQRRSESMSEVYPNYPDVVLAIVIVDCLEPQRLAVFWSELLGRKIVRSREDWVDLEWAPRFGAGLCFQRVKHAKAGKNRVHTDLLCADIAATAARVEALGGRRAEGYAHSQALVMLDPEGNEFCLVPKPGG